MPYKNMFRSLVHLKLHVLNMYGSYECKRFGKEVHRSQVVQNMQLAYTSLVVAVVSLQLL